VLAAMLTLFGRPAFSDEPLPSINMGAFSALAA
jgi:hypothetical protein